MIYQVLEYLTTASIVVRIAAAVWCGIIWPRVRDPRLLWLMAVLACLIIRQYLALRSVVADGPAGATLTDVYAELFAMGTSLLCMGAVWGQWRMIEDRDRAAAALRESGQDILREYDELRAIYDNAPIGMSVVDEGLRFTAINDRLARIHGTTIKQHLGRTIREVVPHLADQLEPIYGRVLSTGQASIDAQVHGVTSADTGSPRDWSVTHYPVRDRSGRVVAVGCTVVDVTERNRAERDLRVTEQTQRALLKAVPDAMFRVHRDGTYLAYSSPNEARLIVPPSVFLGRKVKEVLPGPIADQCMTAIEAALRTGAMQTYEYTYQRSGGTNHWEVRVVVAGADEALLLVRDINERKKAEAELRASREELERAQAAGHVGSWVAELATGRLAWSRETCRIFGIEPAAFDGRVDTFFRHVHPEDVARVREAESRAYASGEPYSTDHRITRPDGEVRWVHERADLLRGADGEVLKLIGVVQDITERRQFEQSLADSENRYRTLFERNPQPMWVCDRASFRFLAVNGAAVKAYGYSESEFLSMTIMDIRPSEDVPMVEATIRESRGEVRGRIWRHRRKNGVVFDAEITAHPIEFRGADAIMAIANDVTERQRAQRALSESEERYRRLAEHGAVGIWEVDLEHRPLYANPTMCAMLEVTNIDELRRQPFESYFTEESRQVLVVEMARRARGEASVYEVELVGARGGRRIAVVSGAPMVDPQRKLTSFVATFTDITDRKMAERALAASEFRFRRVVDSNMVGIFFWKLSGEITDANDLFLRMVGYGRGTLEAGGLRWNTLTPPEWVAADDRATAQLRAGGVCNPYEKEYIRSDGTRVPVLLGAGFLDGTAESGVCFIVDITDRKQAERSLRVAEEKFRTLFEECPDGVMIVDPETASPVEANSAMVEMLGYSREEFLRLKISDFEAVETPEAMREHIRRVVARGEDDFETRMRTRAGDLIEVAIRIQVVMIGGVAQLQTLVRDITARKRAEERLRAAEQRNALMIRQTPLGVIVWDIEKRVVEWNPTAERIFGYTAAEAIGKTFEELLVPPHVRPLVANVWRDLLTQSGGTRSTNDNVTKDGRRILCDWYNSVLVGADGRVIAVASLVQDVTDVKRLEEELRQSQKMEAIGQLASGVAHDFSNLLTAIFGFTSLARRTLAAQHPAVRSLDRVDDAAQQAAGVTRALLTFSRGGESEKRPVRLGQIVDDAVRLLRRTLPTNIDIRTNIEAPAAWVRADRTQLQQIVMNLAINARDAMPDGGTMTVSVGQANKSTRQNGRAGPFGFVRVADTGVGMTPELQERIFEPFFTTKPPGQGTGLGLSIIHGIVKDHHGQIEVESAPGRGSVFTILIPTSDPAVSTETEPGPAVAQPGHGELVILASGRTYTREIMATTLLSLGYRIVQVADAPGLEHALSMQPLAARAVVLDMETLGKDAKRLLALAAEKGTGTVAILDAVDASMIEQLPHAAVLQKPFQMPELAAAVQEALK